MNPSALPGNPQLLVTIVVINHDYGEFVGEAVASALAQTYPATEIVVVDDGSTDGSAAFVEQLSAPVVRALHPVARGHVAALNTGFANSRGDIVIFLDADDRLEPDCAAHVVANWRTGIVKLQYRLATIDRYGRNRQLDFPYYPPNLTAARLHAQAMRTGYYAWPVSSGNAYARHYLEQLLPIDGHRLYTSPDGYLNKVAPLFGEIISLHRVLGQYRVHGRNMWAQDGAAGLRLAGVTRSVRWDVVLHDEFVALAAASGHLVPPYRDCTNPPTIEYRMLSWRLAPQNHPLADDDRWHILRCGLLGAWRTANISPAGRLFWAGWFVCMAILPAPWLMRLAAALRGQLQRPGWTRLLVRLSRGVSSAGPARRAT